MAVAYGKSRVGSAEQRLFVRDAVTADVVLPRFLAPGDNGRVALSLHNVDGQAGDYRVTLEATGAGRARTAGRRDAAPRRQPARAADLAAARPASPASARSRSRSQGPGNFAVSREWDIQVRAAQTPSAVDTVAQLEPARELTLDRNVTAPFAPGTAQVERGAVAHRPASTCRPCCARSTSIPTAASSRPPAAPCRCSTTTTWRCSGTARPIRASAIACRTRSTASSTCSCHDGSFGMWGPFGDAAAEWLQSYALDFLLRARDQQMAVPAASLQRGLTWLNRTADKLSPNAQAYAWYVLAKAGLADPGRVRYFQDTKGCRDQGRPRLGAARRGAEPGGRTRPRAPRLRPSPASTSTSATRNDYYGSPLRNRAALLALAVGSRRPRGRDPGR